MTSPTRHHRHHHREQPYERRNRRQNEEMDQRNRRHNKEREREWRKRAASDQEDRCSHFSRRSTSMGAQVLSVNDVRPPPILRPVNKRQGSTSRPRIESRAQSEQKRLQRMLFPANSASVITVSNSMRESRKKLELTAIVSVYDGSPFFGRTFRCAESTMEIRSL